MIIDRDNVIKGLQELSDEAYSRWVHCQHTRDKLIIGIGRYVDKAIELLEAQKPIKPYVDSFNDDCWWATECCGTPINFKTDKFCPKCGRPIKWDV